MTTSASRTLAIKYALENNWQKAYVENKKIFNETPEDVDTLNRLAYSLIKLGKFQKAKTFYQKVIKIDKTNPIALRNLKRLDTISKRGLGSFETQRNISNNGVRVNLQDLFIEEAGKTKTIDLKNLADKKTLSILQPGDTVNLRIKRSKVFVQMQDNTFIGMLPDSIGMRMIPLMNGGNKYSAYIKALEENLATVFIKEEKKMAKFKNYPSFTQTAASHIKSVQGK